MKRIYISVEGGVVDSASSPDPSLVGDVEIVIVDYDVEGGDPPYDRVVYRNGEDAEANTFALGIEQTDIASIEEEAVEC